MALQNATLLGFGVLGGVEELGAPAEDHRLVVWLYLPIQGYRGYSKLRTHTALGTYGISMPRGIGTS